MVMVNSDRANMLMDGLAWNTWSKKSSKPFQPSWWWNPKDMKGYFERDNDTAKGK